MSSYIFRRREKDPLTFFIRRMSRSKPLIYLYAYLRALSWVLYFNVSGPWYGYFCELLGYLYLVVIDALLQRTLSYSPLIWNLDNFLYIYAQCYLFKNCTAPPLLNYNVLHIYYFPDVVTYPVPLQVLLTVTDVLSVVCAGERAGGGSGRQGSAGGASGHQWVCGSEDPAQLPRSHPTQEGEDTSRGHTVRN